MRTMTLFCSCDILSSAEAATPPSLFKKITLVGDYEERGMNFCSFNLLHRCLLLCYLLCTATRTFNAEYKASVHKIGIGFTEQ